MLPSRASVRSLAGNLALLRTPKFEVASLMWTVRGRLTD